MVQTENKYASLRQLRFENFDKRLNLENDIRKLEFDFRLTNRRTDYHNWMRIQILLGEAYKELMKMVGKE